MDYSLLLAIEETNQNDFIDDQTNDDFLTLLKQNLGISQSLSTY